MQDQLTRKLSAMPEWRVELSGDEDALEFMAERTELSEVRVIHDGDGWLLRWPALDELDNIDDVRREVSRAVSTLAGLTSLQLDPLPSLTADISDATANTVSASRGAVLFAKYPPYAASENAVTRLLSQDMLHRLLELRMGDNRVEATFAFLCADASGFRELYCVYDLVEEDLGGERSALKTIRDSGWAEPREVKRFKRTAGNFKTCGVDARHGKLNWPRVSDPISHYDAHCLVRGIVANWLLWKILSDEDDD